MRVLVNCYTQGIGNAVLLTPLLALAAKRYGPVDILVAPGGSRLVFENNPHVRKTIVLTSPLNLIRTSYARYDLILSPDYSIITVLLRMLRPKALHTVTPLKLVTNRKFLFDYSWLGSHVYKTINNEHEAVTNCRLIEPKATVNSIERPRLYLTKQERAAAKKRLQGIRAPRIGIHPGASGQQWKRYPLKRFKEVIAILLRKTKGTIVLFGDTREREELQTLVIDSKRVVIIDAKLRESMATIGECDVLLGNDSGLAHCASALDVETVVIFGPTNEKRSSPLHKIHQVVSDIRYRPCYNNELSAYTPQTCPCKGRCLDIPSQRVAAEVLRALAKA